jgi:hypothetical protein
MTDVRGFSMLGPGERDLIIHRRSRLGLDGADAPPLCGLALSGGGIRSATFALGLIQGMVRADRFDRVDMLSTVSGGGYIGSFVRSLFIPAKLRFHQAGDPPIPDLHDDEREFAQRRQWALGALAAPAGAKQLRGPLADREADYFTKREDMPAGDERSSPNPIWWLREHGRYLAPNGGGDYIFALAYIVRAWFAMQYVVVVSLLAVFLGFKILAGLLFALAKENYPGSTLEFVRLINLVEGSWLKLSPLLFFPFAIFMIILIPLSTSYWTSAILSQWRHNRWEAGTVVLLLLAATICTLSLPWLTPLHEAMDDGVWLAVYFAFAQVGAAIGLYAAVRRAGDPKSGIYRSEIRRLLTEWLAIAIKVTLFLVILAIIDSLALSLVHFVRSSDPAHALAGVGSLGAAVPLIVWLVHKLQTWMPRFLKLEQRASNLSRIMPGLVFGAGVLAYGIIAIFCAAAAYIVTWNGIPFGEIVNNRLSATETLFQSASVLLLVIVILTTVTGLSSSFLNLSSLHFFYAGRLTRAYLGGSNTRRLTDLAAGRGRKSAANVREYDGGDAIGLARYHDKRILAPVHLVNVTVNETRQAASQLVQRDRKGVNLCLGPGGISIGDVQRTRLQLRAQNAEPLAIGKWMAISGAAASTAMGQATSLGTALLLTFANVRLGYWWFAPELGGRMPTETLHPDGKRVDPRALWRTQDLFETQSYLLNEAAAEYSRVSRLRLNLSDGGHFENTGAYELIRRRLPLILISDAAADPKYEFEDFSNLARKARIDLGAEIRCLSRAELSMLPPAVLALCGTPDDFRTDQARDLICTVICRIDYEDRSPPSLMIVIKPRVPIGAPPDVAAYQRACPRFPQEPTVDQFFGEAQWESYRMLGETLSERLFASDYMDELLKVAKNWWPPTSADVQVG